MKNSIMHSLYSSVITAGDIKKLAKMLKKKYVKNIIGGWTPLIFCPYLKLLCNKMAVDATNNTEGIIL